MNQKASSDSPFASFLPIFLLFSRPALKVSDLLLQMTACQADRGQSPGHLWNMP